MKFPVLNFYAAMFRLAVTMFLLTRLLGFFGDQAKRRARVIDYKEMKRMGVALRRFNESCCGAHVSGAMETDISNWDFRKLVRNARKMALRQKALVLQTEE